jgi:hypothetical protein
MRLMLFGFDAAVHDALREAGAAPAVWVRKGEVPKGGEIRDGTRLIDYSGVSRITFDPVDPRPLDPALLDRICDAAREMHRRSADRITTYAPTVSWTTHEAKLRLIAHFLLDLTERERITHVAFSNIPHEPAALVMEAICRIRGIAVVMTAQSPFPDRFFLFRDLDGLGALDGAAPDGPPGDAPEPPPLPAEPSTPFYMKKVFRAAPLAFRWRRLRATGAFVLRLIGLPFARDPRKFYKAMHKMFFLSETWRLHTRRYPDAADLDRDFIYLPLHLQPELTVDVMGGPFADQALVAEALSRAAPDGWLIYVKENPKQRADARDDLFFRRLRALPNVRLVRSDTDTFALIRACRCVATCTGTAGWEALLMGKPAIAFGKAWWRHLPGAVEWRDSVDFDALSRFAFSRERLEAAFAALCGFMRAGVVDLNYARIAPGFDARENGRKVAGALTTALAATPAVAPVADARAS